MMLKNIILGSLFQKNEFCIPLEQIFSSFCVSFSNNFDTQNPLVRPTHHDLFRDFHGYGLDHHDAFRDLRDYGLSRLYP